MPRKSSVFEDILNSLKGENDNNNVKSIFENLINNDETTMNTLMNLASQMTPHLINSNILSQILNSNPNITDELISEEINSFKKDHPNSIDIINKYLQPYEEKHSNKNIYSIHKFIKSDDCQKALDDPQIQQYLKQIMNSPKIKEKIQQFTKK